MAAATPIVKPRALAERVASLARRLAERNRVLREEVEDLRAHIDRLHSQSSPAAAPAASTPSTPTTQAAPAAAVPPVGAAVASEPAVDRESEQLLELVRTALERTLQAVDDHFDRRENLDHDAE